MDRKKLVLTGIEGFCEGETFDVDESGPKLIGRSRSCDFSLRKITSWMEADQQEKEQAEEFKSVSRRHARFQIQREDDEVTVRISDMSRNGTFVDEERIGPVIEIEDWDEPHYLRLGEAEKFRMELVDDESSDEDIDEEEERDEGDKTGDEDVERETGRAEKDVEESKEENEEDEFEDDDEEEEDSEDGNGDDEEEDDEEDKE